MQTRIQLVDKNSLNSPTPQSEAPQGDVRESSICVPLIEVFGTSQIQKRQHEYDFLCRAISIRSHEELELWTVGPRSRIMVVNRGQF